MGVTASPLATFEHTYAAALEELVLAWKGDAAPAPRLLHLNEALATELGIDVAALRSPDGVAALAGNAEGFAQAYAGHQFGGWVPRLGDGRALLLGEVVDVHGARRDVHLKGSGRTPFARGGDGKAAVGPMLRELIVGEAMHALGIPTTRALAVVATGEDVRRETSLPGAVLARVASSHLRVGTFEYAATRGGDLVRRLTEYAIARHYPGASTPLAFFEAVLEAQASLVARWMHVGFVHGVMNTDNITISGETIDFGPCAFLDVFDPTAVFSSIDHGGRYAFGNQPRIVQWDLARFAETLLPLLAEDQEEAVAVATSALETFPARFDEHWRRGMRAKLGLGDEGTDLIDELLALLRANAVDWTSFFRSLAEDQASARAHFLDTEAFDAWHGRWRALGPDLELMNRVNPVYIPRNHLVEEALAAATAGDLDPLDRLLDAVTRPFEERPGLEAYAAPAPESFGRYRTFCGT